MATSSITVCIEFHPPQPSLESSYAHVCFGKEEVAVIGPEPHVYWSIAILETWDRMLCRKRTPFTSQARHLTQRAVSFMDVLCSLLQINGGSFLLPCSIEMHTIRARRYAVVVDASSKLLKAGFAVPDPLPFHVSGAIRNFPCRHRNHEEFLHGSHSSSRRDEDRKLADVASIDEHNSPNNVIDDFDAQIAH